MPDYIKFLPIMCCYNYKTCFLFIFKLGEYYGASVLGMNLNGDSFTDLLVGATLYSSGFGVDEGKVYVYISNGVVGFVKQLLNIYICVFTKCYFMF